MVSNDSFAILENNTVAYFLLGFKEAWSKGRCLGIMPIALNNRMKVKKRETMGERGSENSPWGVSTIRWYEGVPKELPKLTSKIRKSVCDICGCLRHLGLFVTIQP